MARTSFWERAKEVLSETFRQYQHDRIAQLAAALSFYTLFSIAPLLLISIRVAGAVFGDEAARGQVYGEISRSIGHDAALAIQALVRAAREAQNGTWSAILGLGLALVGASAVFAQLRSALNAIWNVDPDANKPAKPPGWLEAVGIWVKAQLFNFGLVLLCGLLLIASLFASSAVGLVFGFIENITPFQLAAVQIGELLVSLLLSTIVFAFLFKFLPDIKIAWGEVWKGAAVTGLLFNVGKYGISFYLSHKALGSTYGAAGSLVVILLWVYYACQIVFLGAELTQVLSDPGRHRSARKQAAKQAVEAAKDSPPQPYLR